MFARRLRYNLAMLNYVRTTLGIPTTLGIFRGKCRGQAVHRVNSLGMAVDGRIKIDLRLINSGRFVMTLFHEVGHCLAENGASDIAIVAEMAAWKWCFNEMSRLNCPISCDSYGHAHACISSYALDEEHPSKVLAMFTVAFIEEYMETYNE